jgi:mannose-6-phosphate isomerase-like protein (cupin superfamily)
VTSGSFGFSLDASGGERLTFGDGTILIRASAESTGGAFTVFEEIPPLLDTPLHIHANEDELFYVLEGEHVIQCGDEEFRLGPGGVAFLPRGVPHSQRRAVPGEGRLLVLTSPAGFEGFFRELAEAERAGTLGPDAYAKASETYGITWLG